MKKKKIGPELRSIIFSEPNYHTDAANAAFNLVSNKLDWDAANVVAAEGKKRGLSGEELKQFVNDNQGRVLKANGFGTELDKLNRVTGGRSLPNTPQTSDFLKNHKNMAISTKKSWAPGALGLGTAAALGGYYIANRDKRWRDKDGNIDKRKAAKDLGKAGLAGIGMYGAGKITEDLIRGNTQGKINGYVDNVLNQKGGVNYDKVAGGFSKIYKNHNRNLALGMGGLALAGVGGYALHRYLKNKRENRQREGEGRQNMNR
jgi:hypothetical protein|nr:MAG TPA: hypothetical protein [Caudoviricetes sp.]